MALDTYSKVLEGIHSPLYAYLDKQTSTSGHDTAGVGSYWILTGGLWVTGAIPPTGAGEAPNRSTVGALPLPSAKAGEELYLVGVTISPTGFVHQTVYFYDRLVHTSGLSGNITTPQTVNSTALTRNTLGKNNLLFLEIYSVIGSTSVVATIEYTNQAGVAATTTVNIGTSSAQGFPTMIRVPLAPGDSGVRSVESVTLSAGTGTAGNFGITIAQVLFAVGIEAWNPSCLDWAELGLVTVDDTACVSVFGYQPSDRSGLYGHLDFVSA